MIKGVIFDLGHTLLRFTGDLETVTRDGAEAMASWFFKKKRIRIDSSTLIEAFLAERETALKRAEATQTEVTAQQSLRQALEKIEAPASTHALIEPALKIYFEPEEMAWQAYPDAIETLKYLKRQGYPLGLYSNATDDAFVQRLINRNGLRPWLSPTFSSAGLGWRKPKREPFDLIARRWRLAPDELVVVGDTLHADILGAQNAGMHSILVTMREYPSNNQNHPIQPTASVDRLSNLPAVLAQLTLDRE